MLKISYAGCLGLSPAISVQFTVEMHVAARNRKKITRTSYFESSSSRSSMLTFLEKLVASAYYDRRHVCAYMQPFSR